MNRSDDRLLAARGLSCGYPERLVLEDVSLALEAGTSTILLGPNGSGKSTLLKTLMGSLAPLAGSVSIAGHPAEAMDAAARARFAAYVPQEEVPPFRFTVRQVVMLGRLPRSPTFLDSDEDRDVVERALIEADCADLADRPIAEVSGGERQRALIARGLAQEAPMLLLDEPTSHLDIGHQVAILGLVRRLCREGRAVLAAMHDLNLAAEMGSWAILLHGKQIADQGPIEDVLSSPRLDEAYGVAFQRMRDPSGRLRVFAEAAVRGF